MAKGNLKKGRSFKTSQSKASKLRKTYRTTFEHSKKSKTSNIKNSYKIKKVYFCDKYPTEKSFLSKIKIKDETKK